MDHEAERKIEKYSQGGRRGKGGRGGRGRRGGRGGKDDDDDDDRRLLKGKNDWDDDDKWNGTTKKSSRNIYSDFLRKSG